MRTVKIVHQSFTTPSGLKKSWAVTINGIPIREFYYKEQLDEYLRVKKMKGEIDRKSVV